jgi:hypothetical protein
MLRYSMDPRYPIALEKSAYETIYRLQACAARGEHPTACPGCPFTGPTSSLLVHFLGHTGERPHLCTVPNCVYAAAQASTLATHMYAHTGERPYACIWPGCAYSAAQSSTLAAHMRAHTGLHCTFPGCEFATGQLTTLNRHMAAWH